MSYIGLDIGTSGCKAAVVTKDASILAMSRNEYSFVMPKKGFVELNPQVIWQRVKGVLRDLSPYCSDVNALALSGIGESFVLLDKSGKPLNNFITYLDQRCEHYDQWIVDKIDQESLYKITGLTLNQMYSLYKLLWLRNNEPELLDRAESLFLVNDYFNYLLTGERAVDYGTASRTMLFDINKCDWSNELLSLFEIPESFLSPVLEAGTFIGKLLPELAEELELPKDICVYLGCHDQNAANLGAGAYKPGDVAICEGSSESINVVTNDSILKEGEKLAAKQVCIEPFLTKGKYIVPVGFLSFGTSIKWYVDTFEKDAFWKMQIEEESIYAYLDRYCASDTDVVFLPYLTKVNVMDADSWALGAFIGLSISTSKPEIYRAVLEGIHFESRQNFELLYSTDLPMNHYVATGGLAKSALAMQIKADILQMTIHILACSESGVIGLAIICAVAVGDYESYEDAFNKFVRYENRFSPQKDYSLKYRKYCLMSDYIKKAYSDLDNSL